MRPPLWIMVRLRLFSSSCSSCLNLQVTLTFPTASAPHPQLHLSKQYRTLFEDLRPFHLAVLSLISHLFTRVQRY